MNSPAPDRHTAAIKLPVPRSWQAPVEAAVHHLVERLGVERAAVAVTRIDEVAWAGDAKTDAGSGLDVGLLTGGRTYRYRVALIHGARDWVASPA